MMGENSVLSLRKHQINIQEMDNAKVKEDAGFYKTINMLLPSLLVVIFAFIMGIIRKRKYAKR
jgi:ABC-2 type transport system permease protein